MLARSARTSLVATLAMLALGASAGAASAETPAGGKADQSFAPLSGSITSSKPESKLWYAHGSWWAVMGEDTNLSIWRLQRDTETWVDTGTIVESRSAQTRADALSEPDGSLTIASHSFKDQTHNEATAPTGGTNGGLLRRYTFNGTTYSPVDGFPASIEPNTSETLIIDRDSTGTLWAAWTWNDQAWVAHSTLSDASWSTPMLVPGVGALDSDDTASVIHFAGDKIGVMVSNQFDRKVYFAVHADGASDLQWDTETVPTGWTSDDHINLKADDDGRVFAAVKTSQSTDGEPLVLLVVRSAAGTWSTDVFGLVDDKHTRPIVLLDESHRLLHMFATDGQSGGDIVEKATSMDNPDFAPGTGTPVMTGATLNDATSTKQNVDASTGIVVLADNDTTKTYYHYDTSLGAVTPAVQFAATPSLGTAPVTVTFSDQSVGYAGQQRTWDFGDGSAATTSGGTTHQYTTSGTFTVRLTIGGLTATRTVTVKPGASGGGGTAPPVVTVGGTPATPAPPETPAPVTPPTVTSPGNVTVTPSKVAAPKLRGVIQLSGRTVSTTFSCRTSGNATLSHRGTRLASARFTCKAGRAVVRFKLGPRNARRLKRTTVPDVTVTVRIGATSTKLRHPLSRGTD